MRTLRVHQLLALLLVSACGGPTTTIVMVDVATVTVTPTSPSVEVGLTVQFMASASDASGTPITGQPVTWASSVGSVASISADGIATGLLAGTTEISATIGGVTASQMLTVSATPCSTRTDVNLAPGDFMTVPGNECLFLPTGAAGDLYRVAVGRPTLIALVGDTSNVTLEIDPVLAPGAAPQALVAADVLASPQNDDQLPRLDGTRALERLRILDATRAFHMQLRQRELDLGLDVSTLLPNLAVAGAPPQPVDPPMRDDMFLSLDCFIVQPRAVILIDFDDDLAIYQDSISWASDPIPTTATTALLSYYASYAKDMVVDYWGAVPDIDGNGRIIVVTAPSLGTTTAAAVYSGDFLPPTSCASSNEGEVVYFQGDLIHALVDASPNHVALGVLAHEAKHVVSLYNGILRGQPGGPDFNDLWVEEGTAEVSQVMSSRIAWAATGGPAVGQKITATDILAAVAANGGEETAEMSSLVDELAGIVRSVSTQPNSVITDPLGSESTGHSFYNNSWHWHRLLGDAHGNAATAYSDSAFFRALTSPSTPAGGASGEIQLTGRSFDQLFEDYMVAISLHESGFTPTYAFTTWDFESSGDVFSNPNPPGSYPWPVTADDLSSWDGFGPNTYAGPVGPSGVRFHDFRSDGSGLGAQIHVTGADDGVIVVTRLD